MTNPVSPPVRPTKRCLDDLGLAFPPVDLPLHEVDHPMVKKAQQTPAEVAASGAERIRSLTDRVWFKCKVSNLRGAVTKIDPSGTSVFALLESGDAWWWIGAAGERQDGSATAGTGRF